MIFHLWHNMPKMKDANFTYFVVGDYPLDESCPLCGGEVQWRVVAGTGRLQCTSCGEILVQNDCPQGRAAAIREAKAIIRSNKEAGEFAQGYGNLRATKYLTAEQEAEQRLFDTILYFGGSLEHMIRLYKQAGDVTEALLVYSAELPAIKYSEVLNTYGNSYMKTALDRYNIVKGYVLDKIEALPYPVDYDALPPARFNTTPRHKSKFKALHSASMRFFGKRR